MLINIYPHKIIWVTTKYNWFFIPFYFVMVRSGMIFWVNKINLIYSF